MRANAKHLPVLPLLVLLLAGCAQAPTPAPGNEQLAPEVATPALPEHHGSVQAELFLGEGDNQPLLLALGGAEGGNSWADDRWRQQRDEFVSQGFAVLAVGYFGLDGTPEQLDRIALEGVHEAALEAAGHPSVDGNCVAVLGGSMGGVLALLLGSHFDSYKAVVAVVPGSAVFPALTDTLDSSSFSLEGKPLPFVPVPAEAIPDLRAGELRSAFSAMLENDVAVEKASIAVENINGPVLLMSGTDDEYWPSSEMSDDMMGRLLANDFPHHHEHIAVEGGHSAPLTKFGEIERFLATRLQCT